MNEWVNKGAEPFATRSEMAKPRYSGRAPAEGPVLPAVFCGFLATKGALCPSRDLACFTTARPLAFT